MKSLPILCPLCGSDYAWHPDDRNVCPDCGADFGYRIDYPVTLSTKEPNDEG